MNELIQNIKSKLPLYEFIGKYTSLKRSGTNWFGKCPFPDHNEKTPSFCVSKERYKCFGCGKSGDILTFAQEYLHFSFKDGMEMLCKQAGLEYRVSKQPLLHNSYRILEAACEIYEKALNSNVIAYLQKRGIKNYKKYRLGWSGSGLLPNFSATELENAGLMRNGRPFFYNRIMFPIFDSSGICSFGGRAINDVHPKYLNGPQTEIFNKSEILYNFYRGGDLFVVEGYTDVILLSENNIGAVAPMGTSITLGHLQAIWKMNSNPYIAFDGDMAGQRATMRLLNIALPYLEPNKTLRTLVLPKTDDPASIIQNYGLQEWKYYVENAKNMIDILLEQIIGTPENQLLIKKSLQTQIAQIKNIPLRNKYLEMLGIRKLYNRKQQLQVKPRLNLEKYLLGMLYYHPELCKIFQEEIARMHLLPENEKFRIFALQIADGEEFMSEWEILSQWAQPHPDPEEGWREMYIDHESAHVKSHTEYLQVPTPENWAKFINGLKS